MPDCRYCGREFADDGALDRHLREEHLDELGPIDRRRVQGGDGDDGGLLPVGPGPLALAAVLGIASALVIYVVFFLGSGSPGVSPDQVAQTPTDVGGVHYHGTMNVSIAGTTIDATDPDYVHPREHQAFHFDRVGDDRWHVHARGVTLEYAMATFDVGVTEDSVRFDGRTYERDDPDTTVVVEVNEEPVDPSSYVLQRGDHIEVVVRTAG